MNLFVFDFDPTVSAMYLDDVRKNKIILECAQMLSTAMNTLQPSHSLKTYSSFNPNHPCCKWVAASQANFYWTIEYMEALNINRVYYGGRLSHRSMFIVDLAKKFLKRTKKFPKVELTPFANCAANANLGLSFKYVDNVQMAYRMYINERWKRDYKPPTWKCGRKPKWAEV